MIPVLVVAGKNSKIVMVLIDKCIGLLLLQIS